MVVGRTGAIKGILVCDNADFEGKFSGKMTIKDTLSLKSSAHIEGEVVIGKLSVEPGANFNATCNMKGNVKSISKNNNGERSA